MQLKNVGTKNMKEEGSSVRGVKHCSNKIVGNKQKACCCTLGIFILFTF